MFSGAISLWGGCAAVVSFLLCAVLVRFMVPHLGHKHMLADTTAQQALHSKPTPRVGGAAVLTAFAVVLAVNRAQLGSDLALALIAGMVIFAAGLKEDIWRNVSPRARLLAAMISAALAMALTGGLVPALLPQIAVLSGFVVVPVLITLIWSAGTCHALNLIDGLNGLSSSYAVVAAMAMIAIAAQTGDGDIGFTAVILSAALAGFLLLNWPFAKIFMGDAGAYAIGHVLAWLGILLMVRNPQFSPLAILLVLFWPVAETAFSIIRRRRLKRAINQPDRMHFHHIMIRLIARLTGRHHGAAELNPLTTLALLPLFLGPAMLGVMFWDSPIKALIALSLCTLCYILAYHHAVQFLAKRQGLRGQGGGAPAVRQLANAPAISPLGGVFVKDAAAVLVQIVRARPLDAWHVVTKSANAAACHWDQRFATDQEAWAFFLKTMEAEGCSSGVAAIKPNAVPKLSSQSTLQDG
jgi:UDP-GlcNAc:undecaprenyl-phosphate/decaprenyl-phosphate GlcNAc-1-phosphate transferase